MSQQQAPQSDPFLTLITCRCSSTEILIGFQRVIVFTGKTTEDNTKCTSNATTETIHFDSLGNDEGQSELYIKGKGTVEAQ